MEQISLNVPSLIYYVYLHCYPLNHKEKFRRGLPFYAGKGKGNRCKETNGRVKRHCNVLSRYGIENIHLIKYICESEEQALSLEKEIIYLLRNLLKVKLFNLTDGGEGWSGRSHTAETKQLLRKLNLGKKLSPETIKKQRLARLGVKRSEETKAHMSLLQQGISKRGSGWEHSEKTKLNMSLASKGKKKNPEYIRSGYHLSESTIKLLSNYTANLWKDPSYREKVAKTKQKTRELKLGIGCSSHGIIDCALSV